VHPIANAVTYYHTLSTVTVAQQQTATWWPSTKCFPQTVMINMNYHGHGMYLLSDNKIFPLRPKTLFRFKNCQVFLAHPVHKMQQTITMSWTAFLIHFSYYHHWGAAVAQWIRHCATNQKVAGSIPDGVIGIFL